jgi:hypothetical protein
LHHIHPPTPFPHILPTPTGTNLFFLPVLQFCKRRKNDIFV